jgi:hypothetical protein
MNWLAVQKHIAVEDIERVVIAESRKSGGTKVRIVEFTMQWLS